MLIAGAATQATAAVISITDVSVEENAGVASFKVSLDAPVPEDVFASFATADGTATQVGILDGDYFAASGIVFVPANTPSTTIDVLLNDDDVFEGTETFSVALSDPSLGSTINPSQGTATARIADTADIPVLSIAGSTVAEGGVATFRVTRTGPTLLPATVRVTTSDGPAVGGAIAGTDYTATSVVVTIPAADPTNFAVVSVPTINNAVFEGNEIFRATLSAALNASIGPTISANAVITDAVDTPTLAISPPTVGVTEGGSATVSVTRTGATTLPATVTFATLNGTAAAGDFLPTAGTLTFPAGNLPNVQQVVVATLNDGVNEPTEGFALVIRNAVNASIPGSAQAIVSITDNDPTTLAVNDVVVTEGDAGTVTATFSVSLSVPTSGTISAGFTTADGTPADLAATAPADYIAIPAGRAVRFSGAADTAPKPVAVSIQGDTLDEVDENFRILLANPTLTATGVVTTDLLGIGTIIDNDPSPTLTVKDVAVPEGNAGTTTVTLTASLSAASGRTVSAAWTTGASGLGVDATAGVDYVPASGTLTYAPGETSKTLQVTFNGDTTPEGSETVGIVFSQLAGAALLPPPQDVGFFVIADDDQFPVSPFPNADTLTVPQDTPGTVNVLANDVDSNGDFIFVSDNTAPAHGTVTCTRPGACTYTPAAGYAGPDSFTYTVSDGTLAAPAVGTVTITVGKVNKPPTANADRIATVRGVAVTVRVLANDTDVDGDSLTVTGATQPANGTVTCSPAGVCRYTPKAKFLKGTNTFTYTVTDGALSSTGTVTVGVRARKALLLSATATNRRAKSGARNGYAIAIANPNPVGVGLRTLTACLPAGFTVAGRITGDIKTAPKRSSCGTGRVLLTWKIRVTVPGAGRLVVRVPVRVAGPGGNARITLRGAAAPGFTTNAPAPAAPILVAIS